MDLFADYEAVEPWVSVELNGAVVREVQVTMGEREAGQSYLTFWRSIEYMVKMSISILLIQWFRKRDTETPYPERSL